MYIKKQFAKQNLKIKRGQEQRSCPRESRYNLVTNQKKIKMHFSENINDLT
jgi:hypothetical protein